MKNQPPISAFSLYRQKQIWYGNINKSSDTDENVNQRHYPCGTNSDPLHKSELSHVLLPPHLVLLLPKNFYLKKDENISTTNPSTSSSSSSSSSSWRLLKNYNGGGITEIAGEAGSGKTQICLSASVSCVFMTYHESHDKEPDKKLITTQNYSNDIHTATISDYSTQSQQSTIINGNQKKVDTRRTIINPYKKKQKVMNSPTSSSSLNNNINHKKAISNPYSKNSTGPKSEMHHTTTNATNLNNLPKEAINNTPSPQNLKSNLNYYPYNKTIHSHCQPQQIRPSTNNIQNNIRQKNDKLQKIFFRSMFVSMGESVTGQQIAQRLDQIVEERIKYSAPCIYESHSTSSHLTHVKQTILNRILTRFLHNEDDLFCFLFQELPQMLQQQKEKSSSNNENESGRFGLIVFDSIAGIFRIPDSSTNNSSNNKHYYSKRSENLFQISAQMKKLSYEFGIHILIVNQVTSAFTDDTSSSSQFSGQTNSIDPNQSTNLTNTFSVKPSLGLSWSSCINNRYLVTRTERHFPLSDDNDHTGQQQKSNLSKTRFHRELHLLQSSCHPSSSKNSSTSFVIDKIGCREQE